MAPAPAAPPAAPRYLFLDAARLFAAIAIVWIHSLASPATIRLNYFGAFAVPFFTISAIFLLFESMRRHPDRPLGAYAAARFARIYVPFLVWSLIYFAARDLKNLATHHPLLTLDPMMLLTGAAHHTWFLPFLLAVSLLFFLPARGMAHSSSAIRALVAIGCAATGVVIGSLAHPDFHQTISNARLSHFVDRSFTAAPAVFFAIAIAALYPLVPGSRLRDTPVAMIGLAACAACLLFGYLTQTTRILLENAAGLGFFIFALAPWDSPKIRRIAAWGSLAYGLYLAHVLFVEGLQTAADRLHLAASPGLDIATFVGSVLLTLAFVWLLSRWRWTRWLIP